MPTNIYSENMVFTTYKNHYTTQSIPCTWVNNNKLLILFSKIMLRLQ